jgi:cellulose synthase/poly-beta-1,6-N-acetylglucosamine synthase-like glycosyltransferase
MTEPVPALSVVIACRNGARTLRETLEGLVAQRWDRPWEIVLADNGSTDGSAALFLAVAEAHPRTPMRVVDAAAARGKPFALNAGIAGARAPAVAFCDADDVPGEGWLAAMGRALAAHAIVACRIDFDRLNSGWIRGTRGDQQQAGLEALPFLPGLVHAGGGTMGVQRRLVEEIGGFDPAFAYLEDAEFSLRAQLAGHRIHFVPEAVMHVRARADLKPIFRQNFNWGRYEMKLVSRYRDRGVAFAGGWRRYLGGWRRLLHYHLRPGLRPAPETMLSAAWLRAGVGRHLGQLAGMLRYRVPPYGPPAAASAPRVSRRRSDAPTGCESGG